MSLGAASLPEEYPRGSGSSSGPCSVATRFEVARPARSSARASARAMRGGATGARSGTLGSSAPRRQSGERRSPARPGSRSRGRSGVRRGPSRGAKAREAATPRTRCGGRMGRFRPCSTSMDKEVERKREAGCKPEICRGWVIGRVPRFKRDVRPRDLLGSGGARETLGGL